MIRSEKQNCSKYNPDLNKEITGMYQIIARCFSRARDFKIKKLYVGGYVWYTLSEPYLELLFHF